MSATLQQGMFSKHRVKFPEEGGQVPQVFLGISTQIPSDSDQMETWFCPGDIKMCICWRPVVTFINRAYGSSLSHLLRCLGPKGDQCLALGSVTHCSEVTAQVSQWTAQLWQLSWPVLKNIFGLAQRTPIHLPFLHSCVQIATWTRLVFNEGKTFFF